MIDEHFREVMVYLWLASVSFVGGMLGYLRKQAPLDAGKPFKEKVLSWLMSIATSMFVAVIVYDLGTVFIEKVNVCVALGGLASFCGTDALVALEERFIKRIGGDKE